MNTKEKAATAEQEILNEDSDMEKQTEDVKAQEETKGEQQDVKAEEEAATEETQEEVTEGEAAGETAFEEAEEAEKTEEATQEKKSFFKKKEKKKDPRDEKILDLTDKLKRSMAEFDNFRKRSEKEKSQMYEIGAGDVIGKILPVVDNFERGLSSISEDKKDDPIASGMELIYKQLMTALDQLGVKPIEAVGNQFDPNFHNAVMHVEDPEVEENVVVEEFQKGYTYRDSVIRHSMVKVAN